MHSHPPIEDRWMYGVAVVLATCSAVASFVVGYNIPPGHTFFDVIAGLIMGSVLAGISVTVARGLIKIDNQIASKDYVRGGIGGVVWLLFLATEILTCTTFHAGERGASVEQAMVRDDAVAGAGKSVADQEELIKVMQTRLADLQTANGWAATTTAEAMRTQVQTWEDKIKVETERGGCKDKCNALKDKRDALTARINIVEAKDDLSKQIASAEKVLADSRSKVAVMDHGDSKVRNTAELWASVFTGSLHPAKDAVDWTVKGQSGWMGVVGSIGAAYAFWAAYAPRRRQSPAVELAAPVPVPVAAPLAVVAAPVAPAPVPLAALPQQVHHTIRQILGSISPTTPAVSNTRASDYRLAA